MPNYPPPPPPLSYDDLSDTGNANPVLASLRAFDGRLRRQETRMTETEAAVENTRESIMRMEKTLGTVARIGVTIILAILATAIPAVVTNIQTTDRVERLQLDAAGAKGDRDDAHDRVDQLNQGVISLKAVVQGNERSAIERARRTTKSIDTLTDAVNRRRR